MAMGKTALEPCTTEDPTLLYRLSGSFMMLVHGDAAPRQAEWNRYVEDLAAAARRVRVRILVVTDGAGPNAAQREAMNRRTAVALPVAVVTHAVMARRIVSVLGWFNPDIRAFAPAELPAALDYLKVRADEQAGIIQQVSDMRIRLSGGGIESLELGASGASGAFGASVLDPMKAVVTRLSQLRVNIERSRRS